MVVAESGYIVGDELPDIRGLLHIKNDIEQKVLSTEDQRQRVVLLIWST